MLQPWYSASVIELCKQHKFKLEIYARTAGTVNRIKIISDKIISDRIISEMSRYTWSMWPKYIIQPKSLLKFLTLYFVGKQMVRCNFGQWPLNRSGEWRLVGRGFRWWRASGCELLSRSLERHPLDTLGKHHWSGSQFATAFLRVMSGGGKTHW